jgi:hypothetical protein
LDNTGVRYRQKILQRLQSTEVGRDECSYGGRVVCVHALPVRGRPKGYLVVVRSRMVLILDLADTRVLLNWTVIGEINLMRALCSEDSSCVSVQSDDGSLISFVQSRVSGKVVYSQQHAGGSCVLRKLLTPAVEQVAILDKWQHEWSLRGYPIPAQAIEHGHSGLILSNRNTSFSNHPADEPQVSIYQYFIHSPLTQRSLPTHGHDNADIDHLYPPALYISPFTGEVICVTGMGIYTVEFLFNCVQVKIDQLLPSF